MCPSAVRVLCLCAATLAVFASFERVVARPQDGAAPPSAPRSLSDLAWIAGHWRGELGGGVIEEFWSEPEGDSIMGVFRYVKDGKTTFYEMLTIEQEPEGPVLKLKHFNRGLIGWEEKGEVIDFHLVKLGEREAIFSRKDEPIPTRLVFRRTSETGLTVVLEKAKDGKPSATEFTYRKM